MGEKRSWHVTWGDVLPCLSEPSARHRGVGAGAGVRAHAAHACSLRERAEGTRGKDVQRTGQQGSARGAKGRGWRWWLCPRPELRGLRLWKTGV